MRDDITPTPDDVRNGSGSLALFDVESRIQHAARELRAEFLGFALLISAVVCLAMSIFVLTTGQAAVQFWAAVFGSATCIALYLVFDRGAPIDLVAHGYLVIAAAFLVVVNATIGNDGPFSVAFVWFFAIPIAATLLFDFRFGIGWAVVLIAIAGTFLGLDARGYEFDREPVPVATEFMTVVMAATLLLALVGAFHRNRFELERALGGALTSLTIANDEIRDARQRAEAASEAKSRFLANMSHEIRTPMNGVVGMSQLLELTELDREQRRMASTIRQSGQSLLAVINDILDLSKIESSTLELEHVSVNVRDCVESAVDVVAFAAAEKGIELVCDVDASVPSRVVSDPTRIRQSLLNLLGNAVKFTDTGQVSVRVEATACHECDAHEYLMFEVADTGSGIGDGAVERIFDAFAQESVATTRTHGGTGLGLAITRDLVRLMGGDLTVQSEVGAGSTFRFTILAERDGDAGSDAADTETDELLERLSSRPVLVAVARSELRAAVVGQCESVGLDVLEAADLDGIHDHLALSPDCAVALVDLDLPDGDAFRFAHQIPPPAPPLIAFAGAGRALRSEDADVFVGRVDKPVRRDRLVEALLDAVELSSPDVDGVADGSDEIDDVAGGTSSESGPAILVAEDNAVNQMVARKMLERLGCSADIVDDGRAAVEAAVSRSYDLILMDIQMPVLDGIDATREIIAALGDRRPRIVAMTANALVGDREEYLAAGMDDYVAKPVSLEQLQRVVLGDRAVDLAG